VVATRKVATTAVAAAAVTTGIINLLNQYIFVCKILLFRRIFLFSGTGETDRFFPVFYLPEII
jgi:hypothetical protein